MTARQGRRVLRPREAVHPWHEPARAGRSEEVAWGVGPSIRVVDFSLFVSRHASVTTNVARPGKRWQKPERSRHW